MDGIHIVAFAEEADPGEGATLDALGGLVEGGDRDVLGGIPGRVQVAWARHVEMWEVRKEI